MCQWNSDESKEHWEAVCMQWSSGVVILLSERLDIIFFLSIGWRTLMNCVDSAEDDGVWLTVVQVLAQAKDSSLMIKYVKWCEWKKMYLEILAIIERGSAIW